MGTKFENQIKSNQMIGMKFKKNNLQKIKKIDANKKIRITLYKQNK